jgi:hypothetical protein
MAEMMPFVIQVPLLKLLSMSEYWHKKSTVLSLKKKGDTGPKLQLFRLVNRTN